MASQSVGTDMAFGSVSYNRDVIQKVPDSGRQGSGDIPTSLRRNDGGEEERDDRIWGHGEKGGDGRQGGGTGQSPSQSDPSGPHGSFGRIRREAGVL